MKTGDIFYNTKEEPSLAGEPFKVGYYKVVAERMGMYRNDTPVYDIRRCTKNGDKLMKYQNAWVRSRLDQWLAEGRLVLQ